MVAVLQPVNGAKYIAIDRAVVLVGRSADCDAVITNSKKISRKHCCLVQVDDTYFIRDLGSMNGVWVNGARVKREAQMNLGDHVAIGDVEFRFHPNARIEDKKRNAPPPQNPDATINIGAPPAPAAAPGRPAKPAAADEFEVVDSLTGNEEDNPVERIDSSAEMLIIDDDIEGTNEIESVDADFIDEDSENDKGKISMPVLNVSDSLPEMPSSDPLPEDDDDLLLLDD